MALVDFIGVIGRACSRGGGDAAWPQDATRVIAAPPPRRALSEREGQVAACAAARHSNKRIACDLGLSTGTVSVLFGRAAKKLGVTSRVALVRAVRDRARPSR